MDYMQLQDNEYYIKKKFYIIYSLSVLIAFLGGAFINNINQVNCNYNTTTTHI